MGFKVVCVGDLVADIVMEIPSLPIEAGQVVEASAAELQPGGGGNFLIAGARLGMAMVALGALGNDPFGSAVARALEAEGVDVSLVTFGEGATTTTVAVFIDNEGRHAFVGAYSVGPEVQVTSRWERALVQADALFVSGYSFLEPRMGRAALDCLLRASRWGKPTFFDPGPSIASMPREGREAVLAATKVLLLTEEEVGLLGAAEAGGLLEAGPSLVVVKRGAMGCSLWSGQGRLDVPAFPTEVVDTSGAGDCFDAAFVYGYLQGKGLERAAVIANAMGAAMAARRGTGRRAPTAEDVTALLSRYRPDLSL